MIVRAADAALSALSEDPGSRPLTNIEESPHTAADASPPEPTGDAVDGEGTATLAETDSRVLAEAPEEVRETIGPTTDGTFSASSVTRPCWSRRAMDALGRDPGAGPYEPVEGGSSPPNGTCTSTASGSTRSAR